MAKKLLILQSAMELLKSVCLRLCYNSKWVNRAHELASVSLEMVMNLCRTTRKHAVFCIESS